MTVKYNGGDYRFRECDTKNITKEELQKRVTETGKIQYERNGSWLVVPGIGYGWRL